jgi:hypothetical protein
MVAGAGLILLTTVSLAFVKKILLDEVEISHVEVLPGRVASTSTRHKKAAAIGLVAALAIVVLGLFPGPATRVVARGAADEQVIRQTSADRAHLSTPGKPGSRRNRTFDDDDM